MFPQSIEVQMASGNAGDFWCIMENIEVPDMEKRRPRKDPGQKFGGGPGDARRILKLHRQLGETRRRVEPNDHRGARTDYQGCGNHDLVNEGFNATAARGAIALQAEGSEVEFRKLELTPLTKSAR